MAAIEPSNSRTEDQSTCDSCTAERSDDRAGDEPKEESHKVMPCLPEPAQHSTREVTTIRPVRNAPVPRWTTRRRRKHHEVGGDPRPNTDQTGGEPTESAAVSPGAAPSGTVAFVGGVIPQRRALL